MDSPKIITVHRKLITTSFLETLLMLTIILDTLSRSHGDISSFHTNPSLVGSVSIRCSPIACRSTLEVAAECYDISKCLAIAPKGSKKKQCMSCSYPADDGTPLNQNDLFYFRDVKPFQKREKCACWTFLLFFVCFWKFTCILEFTLYLTES